MPVAAFKMLAASIQNIAVGGRHSCVQISGTVKCWGWNNSGQLGDGTSTDSLAPVAVAGLAGVSFISGGMVHTCALLTSGAVKCWGNNTQGRLGNGSTINASTPVDVIGLSVGATMVSAGFSSTCAVVNGAAKCWGANAQGQLGNGSTTDSSTPVNVTGLSVGVKSIDVRDQFACALLISGGVKCWGSNVQGGLGNGTTTDSILPVDVVGLSAGVQSIAVGGAHACALMLSGAVKCWGWNAMSSLGNGSSINSSVPVDVVGLSSGVVEIAAGYAHSCAIMASGGLKCWGYSAYGQRGDGTTGNASTPIDVIGLATNVKAIGAGPIDTCAVVNKGMKCWGYNLNGQLGNNQTVDSLVPVDVIL